MSRLLKIRRVIKRTKTIKKMIPFIKKQKGKEGKFPIKEQKKKEKGKEKKERNLVIMDRKKTEEMCREVFGPDNI